MRSQSAENTAEYQIQKLCKDGGTDRSQMAGNVWITSDAETRSADERNIVGDANLISLSELCTELSISVATGRNWVRLGKLLPASRVRRTLLFSREYVSEIKSNIKNGKNTALKSRRNKKHVSGNAVYHSYISDTSANMQTVQDVLSFVEEKKIEITEELLCAILAECAIQLILSKDGDGNSSNCLSGYLHGKHKSEYFFLIEDLIHEYPLMDGIADLYEELLNRSYVYEQGEDILGLLYISLKNMGSRKATGSYYTPTAVVKKLCRRLFSMNSTSGKDVFDPCCGTGNFILQLPEEVSFEHVYGNDIDSVSVKIARINYALKYEIADSSVIYSHITEGDYLSFEKSRRFDFIIGNPPWGYDFSESQKRALRDRYRSVAGNSIESYDVFVEQALSNLKRNGVLSFVLPEAILNVKIHTPIRQILLACSSCQYLEFLGNAFDKVQCSCIILQNIFTGTVFRSTGMLIADGSREYVIRHERGVSAECLSFSTTDEEYDILEKMNHLSNKVTLSGNARFALGIVTGNNRDYISQIKTAENEMILKGSDLCRYKFRPAENYIVFKPDAFQQTAPVEYYRAPEKLLYRFICNQLVFAYDNKQTLSLNSCNILIPEIPDISVKYVLAILNSRIVQFYYKKRFNSVKILRSYIEQIPIVITEKAHRTEIEQMVDFILGASDPDTTASVYDQLDIDIARMYGLTSDEYRIIKTSLDGENLFLI